jgi:hypothetical protein
MKRTAEDAAVLFPQPDYRNEPMALPVFLPLRTVIVALACCLGIAVIAGCTAKDSAVPFDSKAWKKDIGARPKMIEDLQARLDPGVSRSEVIAMLGEPDRILDGSEVNSGGSEHLCFKLPLGEEAFDVSQFVVVINSSGQVQETFVFEN